MNRARLPFATAAVVLVLLAPGCAGPARTRASYSSKAAATADEARSSVETVIVVVSAGRRHGLPSAFTSVAVAEAEADAASALSGFESVQPPGLASDRIRDRTTDAVGQAVDLLARARILTRRGENPVELLPALRRSSARLDDLATAVVR